MILPAQAGRTLGQTVESGDQIRLANLFPYVSVGTESVGGVAAFGGFLDTNNVGCEGNFLCESVSRSSNRDSGSGTWQIETVSPVESGVLTGLSFTLRNGYANFGCDGNPFCVSTSSSRDRSEGRGTNSWRAVRLSVNQNMGVGIS